MSELIDRQALIESFRECYSGHLGMENSDSMLTFRSICRIINNQPTAYDISKVVEELKEKSDDIPIQYEDNYEKGFDDGIGYAIDIVRKGGVE